VEADVRLVADADVGRQPDLAVGLRLGDERLLARVTRRSGEALGLAPGREVFAVIKTVAIDGRNLSRSGEAADLDDDNEIFDI